MYVLTGLGSADMVSIDLLPAPGTAQGTAQGRTQSMSVWSGMEAASMYGQRPDIRETMH